MNLIEELKNDVKHHSVLQNPWLIKRQERLTLNDLILWLTQEYFVSIAFVNWFLWTAALTENLDAKIILVENIWEELGEGNKENSHVAILTNFLEKLNIYKEKIKILPHTKLYLDEMQKITNENFYSALGALGPANEYLLKLEYSVMYNSYAELKKNSNLPEGKFFQINLEADESHSEKLFQLISKVATDSNKKELVKKGNLLALNARELFYKGLLELD